MSNMYDKSGAGPQATTSYVMLNNYCGNASQLGVSSVAPVLSPYGYEHGVQVTPVFRGVNYQVPAYQSNLMFASGNKGCVSNGNYTNVLDAYHVQKDKQGNPVADAVYDKNGRRVSGEEHVFYVKTSPTSFVNQTCAVDGNCNTSRMVSERQPSKMQNM